VIFIQVLGQNEGEGGVVGRMATPEAGLVAGDKMMESNKESSNFPYHLVMVRANESIHPKGAFYRPGKGNDKPLADTSTRCEYIVHLREIAGTVCYNA
jgi:hypothetical protein